MNLGKLKELIAKDIQQTKEYSEFMQRDIKPIMTAVGSNHYEHLHFFNLGYQFAMEKMQHFLEESND